MNWEVVAFVVYFVLVIGIGVYFFVKSKTGGEKEYFLGGRGIHPYGSRRVPGCSGGRSASRDSYRQPRRIVRDYPGFLVGLIVAVVVTLVTKEPGKDVEAIFDKGVELLSKED